MDSRKASVQKLIRFSRQNRWKASCSTYFIILCGQCDITNKEGLKASNVSVLGADGVNMFALILASVLIASGKKSVNLNRSVQET